MEQHVRRYLSRGWCLLPIQPGGKRPLLDDWVRQASNDPHVVHDWMRRYPGMNLGVACGKSGFFVIDVDKKAGGMESFLAVQSSRDRFPVTLTARTAGGGLHLLYQTTDDFSPRNRKLDKVPRLKGIETRGDGGQIVIAPSFNAEYGTPYQWENDAPIATPPRWLIEVMTRPQQTVSERALANARRSSFQRTDGAAPPLKRLEGAAAKLASMGANTGRNNYLNNAAYGIALEAARGRIDPNYVVEKLRQAARASGLEVTEIEATIRSAVNAAYKGAGR